MTSSTSRPRAATTNRPSRAALARHLAFAAISLVTAAGVVAVASVETAEGGTSPRYQRLWDDLGPKHKRWARQTSMCESGGNRKIHGGGGAYHGAFQFMRATWEAAPKSPGGDPHTYSWRTQAVVAVYLKRRDGARNHWPHCG